MLFLLFLMMFAIIVTGFCYYKDLNDRHLATMREQYFLRLTLLESQRAASRYSAFLGAQDYPQRQMFPNEVPHNA